MRLVRRRGERIGARRLALALHDGPVQSLSGIALKGYTVIAGLGGRAITRESLRQLFEDAGIIERHDFRDGRARGFERLRLMQPEAAGDGAPADVT